MLIQINLKMHDIKFNCKSIKNDLNFIIQYQINHFKYCCYGNFQYFYFFDCFIIFFLFQY